MHKALTKLFSVKFLTLAFAGIAVSLSPATAQTIIYSDTFTRTGNLNGSAPDVASGLDGGTAGATWSANSAWSTNGSVASVSLAQNANAYLPFTPDVGVTYTLSLNLSTTAGSWLANGFIIGASSSATDGSTPWQSLTPPVVFWDLLESNNNIQAFGGGSTSDQQISTASGTQGGLYSITLDETSSGKFTYSYAGPGITTTNYTKDIGSNVINAIGIGTPGGSNSGTVDNFTLSSNSVPVSVPEPSTYAMLLSGALVLALAIRRRSKV